MKKSDVIHAEDEIESGIQIVNPKTLWSRFWLTLQYPSIPLVFACIATVITIFWAGFIPYWIVIQFFLWLAVIGPDDVLPIHLPLSARKHDKHDPLPAGSGFSMSRGSFYVGYVRRNLLEVWLGFKSLTQHLLIFGTTGAGKTESIVSHCVNYLAVGSGFAMQDAKAAPKAMFQIATLCRIFGRDDDLRITNYITGVLNDNPDPAVRTSNDAAVFARASADQITQLLTSLLPPSGGDNKVFQERAISTIAAIAPALTDLRRKYGEQIDPQRIRDKMAFKEFVGLYNNPNISKKSFDALHAYLVSLPGYDESKKDPTKQPEEVKKQFGYAQSYFTRSLATLSDTYGHIYLSGQGEIDYLDAVLNGRVLFTLLPSLEKSGEELGGLGKIVLSALKGGMAVGLGTVFEGSANDVVHNLVTNSEIPYGIANDENAYMLVEGQELMNAQGRGLGFGVMTGTQDISGMLESISKTTKQILSNSAIKQFMYLDDKETTELAIELADTANVLVRDSYEVGGTFGGVFSSKNIRTDRRNRLTPTSLKRQGIGEAFILYQGKIHEVQVFNHGISDSPKAPRTHRYLDSWFFVRMSKTRVPAMSEVKVVQQLSDHPDWHHHERVLSDASLELLSRLRTYFDSQKILQRYAAFAEQNKELVQLMGDELTPFDESINFIRPIKQHLDVAPTGTVGNFISLTKQVGSIEKALFTHLCNLTTEKTRVTSRNINAAKVSNLTIQDDDLFSSTDPVVVVIDETDKSTNLESKPNVMGDSNPDNINALDNFITAIGMDAVVVDPSAPAMQADSNSPQIDDYNSYVSDYNSYVDEQNSGVPDDFFNTDPVTENYGQLETHDIDIDECNSHIDGVNDLIDERTSSFAKGVLSNLSAMPWINTASEYEQMRDDLVETEQLLTGADREHAKNRVDSGLTAVAVSLDYSVSKIPPLTHENAAQFFADLNLSNENVD